MSGKLVETDVDVSSLDRLAARVEAEMGIAHLRHDPAMTRPTE